MSRRYKETYFNVNIKEIMMYYFVKSDLKDVLFLMREKCA